MKKSFCICFLLFSLSLTVFFSCKKDVDKFIPDEAPTWDLDFDSPIFSLYDTLNGGPEVFAVNLSETIVFYTSKGTKISIEANSIKDASGIPITGNAEILVNDIFTQGDMIRHHRPTQTWSRELLRSDGVFRISVFPEGQFDPVQTQVEIGSLRIAFGDETLDPDMELFWGEGSEFGRFGWNIMGEAIVGTTNWPDTTLPDPSFNPQGYELFPYYLNWINCDAFVEIPEEEKTTACVNLPNFFTNENAAVFMVFKSMNSVSELWGNPELKLFCQNNMPLGEEVVLIAMGTNDEGEFFLDHIELIITENMTAELTPAPVTLENLNSFLDSL